LVLYSFLAALFSCILRSIDGIIMGKRDGREI
jgi:hypothetical protein